MVTLEKLPLAATFKEFTSMRARVAWMAHSRPDMSCGIIKMAQVAEQAFGPDAVRALNTVIKRAKAGDDLRLMYPALDRSTLRLRVYVDASFAGNADLSSQVGYVVLLCDHTGASHILSYCSKKCKRVKRSAMAGEVCALFAALDEAFIIRHDLEALYQQRIPLNIFTDSKQALDVITRATDPTEKRLLIDIAGLRESYNRQEISNLGLVATEDNMADAMTKLRCGGALDRLLSTGIDSTPVVQWVIRPPKVRPCPTTGGGGV